MTTWWSRYPWILLREESALQQGGLPFERDAAAFAKGRLVLRVQVTIRGQPRQVTAYYPDSFPYFAPQVLLEGSRFERHHNLEGGLCLLGSDSESWLPAHDTLARLLTEQLPRIEAANAPRLTEEEKSRLEEQAGEPLSNFLQYAQPPEVLLIPDEVPPQEVPGGTLAVRLHPALKAKGRVLGEVRTIISAAGASLAQNPCQTRIFSEPVRGFWVRLSQHPQIQHVLSHDQLRTLFHDLLFTNAPALRVALESAKRGDVLVGGLLYRDELSWTADSDDWVMLKFHVTVPRRGKQNVQYNCGFVRADRAGEQSFLQRAPFLKPLRGKRVLLIGAGNVGAPVAMQLARAGIGQLDVVDHDLLQIGNTVRWPLGRRYAGQPKAAGLADAVRNDFPLTSVTPHGFRVGAAATHPDDPSNYDAMVRNLIAASDLVIDGTANLRVTHLLSDLCSELSKPYLWLSTTHGAAGGVVGRIVPGQTPGCHSCFLLSLGQAIPKPPAARLASVQPGGCTHSTFIGAGVDTDELPLLASRLAIATLCRGEAGGYPDFEWDVGVCTLQQDGMPIAPRWTTHKLVVHPSCRACNPQVQ